MNIDDKSVGPREKGITLTNNKALIQSHNLYKSQFSKVMTEQKSRFNYQYPHFNNDFDVDFGETEDGSILYVVLFLGKAPILPMSMEFSSGTLEENWRAMFKEFINQVNNGKIFKRLEHKLRGFNSEREKDDKTTRAIRGVEELRSKGISGSSNGLRKD